MEQESWSWDPGKVPIQDFFVSIHKNLVLNGKTAHTKGCLENRCVFLYSCKRQMTTHLHTWYRQCDVEARKTWVNIIIMTYTPTRDTRSPDACACESIAFHFLISTHMRHHVRSFHHVVEVVYWHFRPDDVSSKRRLSLPVFFFSAFKEGKPGRQVCTMPGL